MKIEMRIGLTELDLGATMKLEVEHPPWSTAILPVTLCSGDLILPLCECKKAYNPKLRPWQQTGRYLCVVYRRNDHDDTFRVEGLAFISPVSSTTQPTHFLLANSIEEVVQSDRNHTVVVNKDNYWYEQEQNRKKKRNERNQTT